MSVLSYLHNHGVLVDLNRRRPTAVADIPAQDARNLAVWANDAGDHPALTPGKGTHLTPVADDLADIVMIRPRRFVCCTCGAPATRQHQSRVSNALPVRTCGECPPPGLRIVDGPDVA